MENQRYNFHETEAKWQKLWVENEVFRVDEKDKTLPPFMSLKCSPILRGVRIWGTRAIMF